MREISALGRSNIKLPSPYKSAAGLHQGRDVIGGGGHRGLMNGSITEWNEQALYNTLLCLLKKTSWLAPQKNPQHLAR